MTEPTAGVDGVPALPAVITTARLRLIPISHGDAADMLAGRHQSRWHRDYPRRDDVDAAAMVRADADPVAASWGPRHVVLGFEAVGSIGCFGPPVDGEGEVGFGLVEAAQQQGLASEMLTAFVAECSKVGVRLRAAAAPGNAGSLTVLASCGFTQLRGSTEDGQLVMARP